MEADRHPTTFFEMSNMHSLYSGLMDGIAGELFLQCLFVKVAVFPITKLDVELPPNLPIFLADLQSKRDFTQKLLGLTRLGKRSSLAKYIRHAGAFKCIRW